MQCSLKAINCKHLARKKYSWHTKFRTESHTFFSIQRRVQTLAPREMNSSREFRLENGAWALVPATGLMPALWTHCPMLMSTVSGSAQIKVIYSLVEISFLFWCQEWISQITVEKWMQSRQMVFPCHGPLLLHNKEPICDRWTSLSETTQAWERTNVVCSYLKLPRDWKQIEMGMSREIPRDWGMGEGQAGVEGWGR